MNYWQRITLVWCGACLLGAAYWSMSTAPSAEWRWQQECAQNNGEWVQGAQRPTCALQGGRLLVMDEEGEGVPGDVHDMYIPEECLPSLAEGGGLAKNIDFTSWPEAVRYRTAMTNDYRRGANWQERYTVALWGCPKDDQGECVGMAMIDRATGRIVQYHPRLLASPQWQRSDATITLQSIAGEEVVKICAEE